MPRKKKSAILSGITRDPEHKLMVQKSLPLFELWRSDYTLAEFKILDTYLSRINSHEPGQREVRFEKGELEHLLGVQKINAQDLKNRVRHLMQPLIINHPDNRGFTGMALFDRAVCTADDYGVWQVDLKCSHDAMQYVFDIEQLGYLRYALRCVMEIKSRYSYVLFLYLQHNRFRKTWEISVENLRHKLACDDDPTYKEFKYFNGRILKRAHKELTEKTECQFAYEPVKRGRTVTAIRFTIETQEQLVFDVLPELTVGDDIYNRADTEFSALDDNNPRTELLREMFMQCQGEFNRHEIDTLLIVLERVGAPIHDTYNLLLLLAEKYELMCRAKPNNRFAYLKAALEKIYNKKEEVRI